MPTTFLDVYSAVLQRAPAVDPLLVRDWVQEAYEESCDAKVWSHQRAETAITTKVSRGGTATATLASASLAGVGMTFVASDVGRQIRLSSIPIYTIIAVDTINNVATLDRIYSEVSVTAGAFTIFDPYWTAPEDFWRFLSVIDPTNKWRLRIWVTEDTLNRIDPARQSVGNPWCVASQKYSPVVADAGRPRFELYPYMLAAASYIVSYYQKPTILSEDTVLIGPFSRGGKDLLIQGALARCAMWPGTTAVKNVYYDKALAAMHQEKFNARLQNLESKDDDIYPTYLMNAMYDWAPVPWDSNWLQTHATETIESSY